MSGARRSVAPAVSRPSIATLLAMMSLLFASAAGAQTPLNQLQFFSLHNAFQRSNPESPIWTSSTNVLTMADQLDELNVWHMELDLFFNTFTLISSFPPIPVPESPPYKLWVGHTPVDPRGLNTFAFYLSQIASTRRIQDGFVVVGLQMATLLDVEVPGDTLRRGPGPHVLEPQQFEVLIADAITTYFPGGIIYTNTDWEADGRQWPTPEELVNRGKRIAFYLNVRASGSGAVTSPLFLNAGGPASGNPNAIWKLGTPTVPSDPTVASYRFPEAITESDANWETANGHTFVGTTEPAARDFDERFHPPVPSYVQLGASSCAGRLSCGRGTWISKARGITDHSAISGMLNKSSFYESFTGKRSIIPVRLTGTPQNPVISLTGGLAGGSDYVIDESVVLINDTGADLILD